MTSNSDNEIESIVFTGPSKTLPTLRKGNQRIGYNCILMNNNDRKYRQRQCISGNFEFLAACATYTSIGLRRIAQKYQCITSSRFFCPSKDIILRRGQSRLRLARKR